MYFSGSGDTIKAVSYTHLFDKSEVDIVVSIKDIYPALLAAMKRDDLPEAGPLSGSLGVGWGLSGGEAAGLDVYKRQCPPPLTQPPGQPMISMKS